jgi:hypothetical protein
MWQLLWGLVELALNKYSDYKVKQTNDSLEKEKIRAQTEQSKDKWKAVILTSTGAWWFQLFFIVPLALWFASVVIYSIFWCQACAFPQPWSIARLPDPLNDWAAAIIGFLFLTQVGKR